MGYLGFDGDEWRSDVVSITETKINKENSKHGGI